MDGLGIIQSILTPDLIKMIQPLMTPEFMKGVANWATWMSNNPDLIKAFAATMETK